MFRRGLNHDGDKCRLKRVCGVWIDPNRELHEGMNMLANKCQHPLAIYQTPWDRVDRSGHFRLALSELVGSNSDQHYAATVVCERSNVGDEVSPALVGVERVRVVLEVEPVCFGCPEQSVKISNDQTLEQFDLRSNRHGLSSARQLRVKGAERRRLSRGI